MANAIAPYDRVGIYRPVSRAQTSLAAPWLQNAQSIVAAPAPEPETVNLIDLLLQKGISGGVGVALGLLQAELKNGLDVHKVPVDLAASMLADVIGYATNSPATVAVGSSCFTVYSFRKTLQLLGVLHAFMGTKDEPTISAHGETVVTPVEETPSVESDVVVKAGETL